MKFARFRIQRRLKLIKFFAIRFVWYAQVDRHLYGVHYFIT